MGPRRPCRLRRCAAPVAGTAPSPRCSTLGGPGARRGGAHQRITALDVPSPLAVSVDLESRLGLHHQWHSPRRHRTAAIVHPNSAVRATIITTRLSTSLIYPQADGASPCASINLTQASRPAITCQIAQASRRDRCSSWNPQAPDASHKWLILLGFFSE